MLYKIYTIFRKILLDLASTFYDDYEFKYMSAPRVWGWLACITVIQAEIAEQYFGLKFNNWTPLIAWATTAFGAYAAKKYIEKGSVPNGNQGGNTG